MSGGVGVWPKHRHEVGIVIVWLFNDRKKKLLQQESLKTPDQPLRRFKMQIFSNTPEFERMACYQAVTKLDGVLKR